MSDSPSELAAAGDLEARPEQKAGFNFWRWFWLTTLVLSLPYAWYCYYVPPNAIAWADDFASAQTDAADSGRPMILYFTGTWCVPCRIMKREVWADEQVKTLVNADFVPVAIDVGNADNAAVLARYGIKGAPVTIVADAEGNALDWRSGGISKAEFLTLLDLSSAPGGEDR